MVGLKGTLLILALCSSGFAAPRDQHPDVGLNVIELVEKYGYPIEQHKNIETEDGYLLDMHRIPHGLNNAGEADKPAVLLMHGLLSSSADWVNMGPEKSLAYILADLGYDVWMGNARGNTWSRKHVTYNPNNDNDFWKFSWNEIGVYDLTRKIDYIIEKTGQEKIFYVGHSQGTTSFFVMASEMPEYNDKIRLMVALAPVAYMSHLENPFFQLLATFENSLEWLLKFVGIYEFMPNTELLGLIGQLACNDDAPFQEVCANIFFLIGGYDSPQLDRTMIPVISTNVPAGAATDQMIHYAQGINSGYFRKFDYGIVKNLVVYGHITPPDYELGQITAPVALFYSSNDWLASTTDVGQLYRELPNCVYKYLIPFDQFNHLDFLWAIDINELLHNRVISLMARY